MYIGYSKEVKSESHVLQGKKQHPVTSHKCLMVTVKVRLMGRGKISCASSVVLRLPPVTLEYTGIQSAFLG